VVFWQNEQAKECFAFFSECPGQRAAQSRPQRSGAEGCLDGGVLCP